MIADLRDNDSDEKHEIKSTEKRFKLKGKMIKHHLDDAVTLFRHIAEGCHSKHILTMSDVQSMVTERCMAFYV